MKKETVHITLHRETLKQLSVQHLASVGGGISAVCTHGVLCNTHVC
jgi:hypothetical protein